MTKPSDTIMLKLMRASLVARAISVALEDDIRTYRENPNIFPYCKYVEGRITVLNLFLREIADEWENDA